jgi:hypothetical protein
MRQTVTHHANVVAAMLSAEAVYGSEVMIEVAQVVDELAGVVSPEIVFDVAARIGTVEQAPGRALAVTRAICNTCPDPLAFAKEYVAVTVRAGF